ncbi:hypothetical protein HPP92_022589 [Vanilla planifolia]|uniref:Probable zinc-ribbon domain-containing protein n=1 Tax=Vanilla planifolia TaxID=51239 RepID=A0A835UHD3_VANPL|nr:hypothetical protein HPP92_022589 [Vanilla planifolia]
MGDNDEAIPLAFPSQKDESLGKIEEGFREEAKIRKQLRPSQLRSNSLRTKHTLKASLNRQLVPSHSVDNVADTLTSPNIRSSHGYDASFSSSDHEPYDHSKNRFRIMSRRTLRHQTFPQPAINGSKEEEATVEMAQPLPKRPLKSRPCRNEITCCADSKTGLHPLRSHLSAPKQGPFVSSSQQSNHIAVDKKLVSGSPLKQPILDSLSSQKHGQRKQLNKVDDCTCQNSLVTCHRMERNSYPVMPFPCSCQIAYTCHSHCSSYKSSLSGYRSTVCHRCVPKSCYHSLTEEMKSLSMKEKKHHAKHHCRPIAKGAPFVICTECFALLLLPLDICFSRRRSNKLRCGACSKVFVLQFSDKDSTNLRNLPDNTNDPHNCIFSHANALPLTDSYSLHPTQDRKVEQKLGPPLHQLMGYSSATELLY